MATHWRKVLRMVQAGSLALGAALPASMPAQQMPARGLQTEAIAVPPLYGPLGVTPEAVKQGQLGSCYFHAVIAAIANHDASLIRRSIKDSGDGSYAVHLPDGTAETIHLEDVMFGRQNHFDLSDGLWVTVLLRALAQDTLRKALLSSIAVTSLPSSARLSASQLVTSSDTFVLAYDRAVRAVLSQDGNFDRDTLKNSLTSQARLLSVPAFFSQPVIDFLDTQGFFTTLSAEIRENGELFGAYRGVGQGGLPSRVMLAFGLRAKTGALTETGAGRALVERVNDPGTAMIAATATSLRPEVVARINSREGPSWLVMGHAYTVLSYDPSSDTVKLRNPWGRLPEPSGVFRLPMNDFLTAFSQISFSN